MKEGFPTADETRDRIDNDGTIADLIQLDTIQQAIESTKNVNHIMVYYKLRTDVLKFLESVGYSCIFTTPRNEPQTEINW
jgi:hypothetical protein